jgi:hypothetical protein
VNFASLIVSMLNGGAFERKRDRARLVAKPSMKNAGSHLWLGNIVALSQPDFQLGFSL